MEEITLEDFNNLQGKRKSRGHNAKTPLRLALEALPAGKAMIISHEGRTCPKGTSTSCGLSTLIKLVARARALRCSIKHLPDGRLALAFFE